MELPAKYTVRAGDTLSSIALEFYGTAVKSAWKAIHNANRDTIGENAARILPGMELIIPDRTEGHAPVALTAAANRRYTVQPGDTLSSIALDLYGSALRRYWMAIYEANKVVIGDNPGLILPGMALDIPTLDDDGLIRSDQPVTLTIANETYLSLDVFWLNYQGDEQHYGTIAPFASYDQPTYATHVFVVRDTYSQRELLRTVIPAHDSHATIDHSLLFSRDDGYDVDARFLNVSPFVVDVSYLDPDGDRRHHATLAPGASATAETRAGYVWQVHTVRDAALVDVFIMNQERYQTFEIGADTFNGQPRMSLALRNRTAFTLQAYWVYDNKELLMQKLEPFTDYDIPTYAGQSWVLREATSGVVVQRVVAHLDASSVFLSEDMLQPEREGHPISDLTISNFSYATIVLYHHSAEYPDPIGKPITASLRPQETAQLSNQGLDHTPLRHGDLLVARDQLTRMPVQWFLINHNDHPHLQVRQYDAAVDHRYVDLHVTNYTRRSLQITDGQTVIESELVYHTIHPGEKYRIVTNPGQVWVAFDDASHQVISVFRASGSYEGEPDHNIWSLSQTSLSFSAQQVGDLRATVRLVNAFSRPVEIYVRTSADTGAYEMRYDRWLAQQADIHSDAPAVIMPAEMSVYTFHAFQRVIFREISTQREIDYLIALPEQSYTYEIAPLATESERQQTVQIYNNTGMTVSLFRNQHDIFESVGPGESVQITERVGERIVAREINSGEAVDFFHVIEGSPVRALKLNCFGRSLSHADDSAHNQVTIRFDNTTDSVAEIWSVTMRNERDKLAEVAAGASSIVTASPRNSYVLIRRVPLENDQFYTDTIGAYYPTTSADQVCEIGEVPVLTSIPPGGLRAGEVALYAEPNYRGAVYVLRQSMTSFYWLHDLDNQVESIRLGPNTAAYLYRDPGFHGPDDLVLFDTPDLRQTAIGPDQLSSLRLMEMPEISGEVKISNRLTFDYREPDGQRGPYDEDEYGLIKYPTFQVTLTLPAGTLGYRLGLDAQAANPHLPVIIGSKTYNLARGSSQQFPTGQQSTVILNIPVNQLGLPALYLTVPHEPHRRYLIQPDEQAVNTLVGLHSDAFNRRASELGLSGTTNDRLYAQKAMQALGQTLQQNAQATQVNAASGEAIITVTAAAAGAGATTSARTSMMFSDWHLNLRGDEPSIKPISGEDTRNLIAGAVATQSVEATTAVRLSDVDIASADAITFQANAGTQVQALSVIDDIIDTVTNPGRKLMLETLKAFGAPKELVDILDLAFGRGLTTIPYIIDKAGDITSMYNHARDAMKALLSRDYKLSDLVGVFQAWGARGLRVLANYGEQIYHAARRFGNYGLAFVERYGSAVFRQVAAYGEAGFRFVEKFGSQAAHYARELANLGVLDNLMRFSSQQLNRLKEMAVSGITRLAEMGREGWDLINRIGARGWQAIQELGADALDFMIDMGHSISKGLEEFGASIEHVAGVVARAVIRIGEKTVQIVMETVEAVGEFLVAVADQISLGFGKLVRLIGSVFGWEDVLATYRYLKQTSAAAIQALPGVVDPLRRSMLGFLTDQREAMLATFANYYTPSLPNRADSSTLGLDMDEVMDQFNWVMDKVSSALPDMPYESGVIDRSSAEWQRITSLLASLAGRVAGVAGDVLTESASRLVSTAEALATSSDNPQALLDHLLGLVGLLIDNAFEIVTLGLEVLFEIMELLARALSAVLTATWDIPVLSSFFRGLTGDDLSVYALVSLLVAIPTTVIGKVVLRVAAPAASDRIVPQGSRVFAASSASAAPSTLFTSDKSWSQILHEVINYGSEQRKTFWKIVYGSNQLIAGGVGIVQTIFNTATSDNKSPAFVDRLSVTLGITAQIASHPQGYLFGTDTFDILPEDDAKLADWEEMPDRFSKTIWLYQWQLYLFDRLLAGAEPKTFVERSDLKFMRGFRTFMGALHLTMILTQQTLVEERAARARQFLNSVPDEPNYIDYKSKHEVYQAWGAESVSVGDIAIGVLTSMPGVIQLMDAYTNDNPKLEFTSGILQASLPISEGILVCISATT